MTSVMTLEVKNDGLNELLIPPSTKLKTLKLINDSDPISYEIKINNVTQEIIPKLQENFPNLENLILKNIPLELESIAHKNLKSLNLDTTSSAAKKIDLHTLTNLENLTLVLNTDSKVQLDLPRAKKLRKLEFKGDIKTLNEILQKYPDIDDLEIESYENTLFIPDPKKIRRLVIRGDLDKKFDLSQFSNLEELELHSTNALIHKILDFKQCKNLRCLKISAIAKNRAPTILSLPSGLQQLTLERIDFNTLPALIPLKNLKSLTLGCHQDSDPYIDSSQPSEKDFSQPVKGLDLDLSHLTELENFQLTDTVDTAIRTIHLSNLSQLRKVDINRCAIEAINLSQATSLHTLRIQNAFDFSMNVTKCHQLKKLELNSINKITVNNFSHCDKLRVIKTDNDILISSLGPLPENCLLDIRHAPSSLHEKISKEATLNHQNNTSPVSRFFSTQAIKK